MPRIIDKKYGKLEEKGKVADALNLAFCCNKIKENSCRKRQKNFAMRCLGYTLRDCRALWIFQQCNHFQTPCHYERKLSQNDRLKEH